MKTAYPATLQDLVFEGRNKAYGAYMLRKLYPRHLMQGLFMAIALFLLLITLPVLVGKLFGKDDFVTPVIADTGIEFTHVILPPQPPAPVAEPDVPKGGQKNVATVKDVTPLVVEDTKLVTDEVPPRDEVAQSTASLVTTEGDGKATTDNPAVGNGDSSGLGTGSGTGAPAVAPTEIFISVQQMPEFDGGQAQLMNFISKNIRYPASAKKNEIEGLVVVSFVIEPTGEVSTISVLKGLGYGTEEEAMRVLKKMPRWKPGVQNGRKVPVRMTLPIRLTLQK